MRAPGAQANRMPLSKFETMQSEHFDTLVRQAADLLPLTLALARTLTLARTPTLALTLALARTRTLTLTLTRRRTTRRS